MSKKEEAPKEKLSDRRRHDEQSNFGDGKKEVALMKKVSGLGSRWGVGARRVERGEEGLGLVGRGVRAQG